MQATKHIISALLIIMVFCSGLPLFDLEDTNRDTRVDLSDAVLDAMDLARTVDRPGAFASKIKRALSTLYMVAGLKTVIKQAGDKKPTATTPCLDLPYLISSTNFSLPSFNPSQLAEKTFLYESIMSTPILPPPQVALEC